MGQRFGPDLVREGIFRDSFTLEDGKLWRDRVQLNRQQLLQANAELRKLEQAQRDGMRWALRIPVDDHQALIQRNPDLASPDREIKRAAWAKFLHSDESLPYRVYHAKRGMTA